MEKPIGGNSIQDQYRQLSVEKTSDKRLDYLMQYHRSLSIQFGGMSTFSRESIEQLKRIEKEIETLLGVN